MFNNGTKYQVTSEEKINSSDLEIITKYYQPIIGSVATLLYLNLFHDLNKGDSSMNKIQCYINTTVDNLYTASTLLTKVRLLNIYKDQNDDKYVFELEKPKTRNSFFNDAKLAGALKNCVGEVLFETLKGESYSTINLDEYVLVSEKYSEKAGREKSSYELYFEKLNLANSSEEFSKLVALCEEHCLTKQQIDSLIVSSLVGNKIDVFKFEMNINQAEINKDNIKEDTPLTVTNKDQAFEIFDKMQSELFLMKINNGRKLSSSEASIINVLRNEYQLNDPVINVLIDYVLRINDMILNKNFIESIAGSWARNNITTSTQAVDFVKNYKKKQETKREVTYADNTPEWIMNDEVESKSFEETSESMDTEVENISFEEIAENKDAEEDIFANFQEV